jgi:hypothetical protein
MRSINLTPSGSGLKWLFGETLVVVLGVLIALWINDYWTVRQDRNLEQEYLVRILEDVESDIVYIDNNVSQLLNTKFKALEAIGPVVHGEQAVPEDVESFLKTVSLAGIGGASSTHWVVNTTFQDLVNTGNLRLIRDSTLRRKIATYYEDFDEFFLRSRDRRTGYARFVWTAMPGELRDDMTLDSMQGFGLQNALARVTSEEFQHLWNQEYNFALFNQRLSSESAKALKADLEHYISDY